MRRVSHECNIEIVQREQRIVTECNFEKKIAQEEWTRVYIRIAAVR